MMSEHMKQAIEKREAAKASLDAAQKELQATAMALFREAVEACREAGVQLPDLDIQKRATHSQRYSESMRRAWAAKTPEQRAAWAAAIKRGRQNHGARIEVQ